VDGKYGHLIKRETLNFFKSIYANICKHPRGLYELWWSLMLTVL